jgi:hypothetical protein
MEKFLIIDTEETRVKIKVTNTQINLLTQIIKKVNKDLKDYKNSDGYPLFKELINSIVNEEDIVSINIVYQN